MQIGFLEHVATKFINQEQEGNVSSPQRLSPPGVHDINLASCERHPVAYVHPNIQPLTMEAFWNGD